MFFEGTGGAGGMGGGAGYSYCTDTGCGDGCRNVNQEECDDGNLDETLDVCTENCLMRAIPVEPRKPLAGDWTLICDHYVAPEGASTGDGSILRPWDIDTALDHPSALVAGDTVCLRGGVYGQGGDTLYHSSIAGTTNTPIVIRSFPGERAIINGGIELEGAWVDVRDVTVMNDHPERIAVDDTVTPPNIHRNMGIFIEQDDTRVINSVVHDVGQTGIATKITTSNAEIYGNIIFNGGWEGPTAKRGVGIGTPGSNHVIRGNTVLNHFVFAFWSNQANTRTFDENIFADWFEMPGSGTGTTTFTNNSVWGHVRVGLGTSGSATLTFDDNMIFEPDNLRTFIYNWSDQHVHNNLYWTTGPYTILYQDDQVTLNSASWESNTYFHSGTYATPFNYTNNTPSVLSFTDWKSTTGFDTIGSAYVNSAPSSPVVKVYANAYEPKRAHIAIFNAPLADTVEVYLNSLGFEDGDQLEIWNMHNLCGDRPLIQIYDDNDTQTIPMTNWWTVAQPIGYDGTDPFNQLRDPHPQFAAFLVTSGKLDTMCGGCRNPLAPNAGGEPTCATERRLGDGRHPVSAAPDGSFGAAYMEFAGGAPALALATYDVAGVPTGRTFFDDGTTTLFFSNPVVAGLPDGSFATAWTDLNGDGDQLGIALRKVTPGVDPGSVSHANQGVDFSQYDPDILWAGNELVVAWVDDTDPRTAPDVRYRLFDENLSPLGPDLTLAESDATEADVALAPFDGSWAVAWRSLDNGQETIEVRAGAVSWSVGPYPSTFNPGAAEDVPALAEIDATHLLVVFTEGTDPMGINVTTTPRLRYAVLDTASPGTASFSDLDPLQTEFTDPEIGQSHPTAVNVFGRLYVGWRSENPLADDKGEEVWFKQIPVTSGVPDMTDWETDLPVGVMEFFSLTPSDQRRLALASAWLDPEGAVIAVWEEYGNNFGDGQARSEVAVQLVPSPIHIELGQ